MKRGFFFASALTGAVLASLLLFAAVGCKREEKRPAPPAQVEEEVTSDELVPPPDDVVEEEDLEVLKGKGTEAHAGAPDMDEGEEGSKDLPEIVEENPIQPPEGEGDEMSD